MLGVQISSFFLNLIGMGRCPRLTSFTPSGLKNKEYGNIEICQLLVSVFEACPLWKRHLNILFPRERPSLSDNLVRKAFRFAFALGDRKLLATLKFLNVKLRKWTFDLALNAAVLQGAGTFFRQDYRMFPCISDIFRNRPRCSSCRALFHRRREPCYRHLPLCS